MDESALQRVKDSFAYERWRGRNTLDEGLFVRGYAIRPDLLPGWRLHRQVPLSEDGPVRATRSIWMREPADPDALLRVEVYECESRAEAQELAVQLLANFQSPFVALREDLRLGDAAFMSRDQGAVVFARANLVFVVARAGRKPVPVLEVADQLDDDLTQPPGTPAPPRRSVRGVVARALTAAAPAAAMEADAVEKAPEPRAETRRYFSRAGEVRAEGARLVFDRTDEGKPDIRVVTRGAEGAEAVRSVDLPELESDDESP